MSYYLKILILSLLIISNSWASSLQEEAYLIANKDSTYVRERNNDNRSERIDLYNKNVSNRLGEPYCAAAVYSWYKEGSEKLDMKNPLYKTGATKEIYFNAIKNPMRFQIIKPSNVLKGSERLQLGDIVLFSTSSGFAHGHTEFLVNQIDKKTTHNIGANTVGGDTIGEQREQSKESKETGGVYNKKRVISTINPKWETKAYIRLR